MKRRICISSDEDDVDSMPNWAGKNTAKLDTLLGKFIDSVFLMNGKMEGLSNRVAALEEKLNEVKSELTKLKKSQEEGKTVFVGSHLVTKLTNLQKSVENELPVDIASGSEGCRLWETCLDVQQPNQKRTVDAVQHEEKKISHGKEDDPEEDKENENVLPVGSENKVAEHTQSWDEDNNSQEEVVEPTQGSVKSSAPKEALKETVSKKTTTLKGTERSKRKDEDNDSEEEEAEDPKQGSAKSSAKKDASRKSESKKTPTTKGAEHSQIKHKDNVSEDEPEEPKKGSVKSSKRIEASRKSESKTIPTTKGAERFQCKLKDNNLEEEAEEPKQGSVKLSAKKEASRKSKLTSEHPKESSRVCTSVASSTKKKDVETKRKHSARSKSATNVTTCKEKAGTKLGKRKDERRKGLNPSEDELRHTIVKILDEVDMDTATFTDIVKKLAAHYDMDFTPRKDELKRITKEEMMKLADEEDETEEEDEMDEQEETEEDDGGESEKGDARKPAAKRVKTCYISELM